MTVLSLSVDFPINQGVAIRRRIRKAQLLTAANRCRLSGMAGNRYRTVFCCPFNLILDLTEDNRNCRASIAGSRRIVEGSSSGLLFLAVDEPLIDLVSSLRLRGKRCLCVLC